MKLSSVQGYVGRNLMPPLGDSCASVQAAVQNILKDLMIWNKKNYIKTP